MFTDMSMATTAKGERLFSPICVVKIVTDRTEAKDKLISTINGCDLYGKDLALLHGKEWLNDKVYHKMNAL